MIKVGYAESAVDPLEGFSYDYVEEGYSINRILEKHGKKEVGEDYTPARPVVATVNNQPWTRDKWDLPLPEGSVVCFLPLAGGIIAGVLTVVALVAAAVAIYFFFKSQGLEDDFGGNPDPVYSLKGTKNQVRLSNPIECPYGRNRIYPSYAAKPYNYYDNDGKQWQRQLFCVGVGYYDFEEFMFSDTDVSHFGSDVRITIYEPNQTVGVWRDRVDTSEEVANIELYAPNQNDYEGWTTGFSACPVGEFINRLEVDYQLPQGLYDTDKEDGDLKDETVEFSFEYARINDDGDNVSGWIPWTKVRLNAETRNPIRKTIGIDVPDGRYMVRAIRHSSLDSDGSEGSQVIWEALRGFLPSVGNYGDVTLIAVEAKATANLNDQSAGKFNTICTRKLQYLASGYSEVPVATRSAADAFCDLYQNYYGGQAPASFINFAKVSLANGSNFDWVFAEKSTVWDAAVQICQVARCLPVPTGTRIGMVKDGYVTDPVAIFTPDNIIAGTFEWSIEGYPDDPYDAYEVEYRDETTFKPETLYCGAQEGDAVNTKKIKASGITNRTEANKYGYYHFNRYRYVRERISFETGREGFIPAFGDVVAVNHWMPKWSQSGYVLEDNGDHLVLSTDLVFESGKTHHMYFKTKNGLCSSPITVTAGADANRVVPVNPPADLFVTDPNLEPTTFVFGVDGEGHKMGRIVGIQPQGEDSVRLELENYDERVFSGDGISPPPLATPTPPSGSLPSISSVSITLFPDRIDQVRLTWSPSPDADTYVVRAKLNGSSEWETITRTSSLYYDLDIEGQYVLEVQVAGVGSAGIGNYTSTSREVGLATIAPTQSTIGLADTFDGETLEFVISDSHLATLYTVEFFDTGDMGAGAKSTLTYTAAGEYGFSYARQEQDGWDARAITAKVTASNNIGDAPSHTLVANNPSPAKPNNVVVDEISNDASGVSYNISCSADSSRDRKSYRLWASDTQGFTPSAGNQVDEKDAASLSLYLPKSGGSTTTTYIRVAAIDVWDDTTSYSDEIEITSTT